MGAQYKKLPQDILECISEKQPCTAGEVTVELNQKYRGQLTATKIATWIKPMVAEGKIEVVGKNNHNSSIYRVGAVE